jgi:tetratricopeptide (TPR) repeat protein
MTDHSMPPGFSTNVDAEHPWLGLASYTEETRAYFHGRDEDAAELSRRVQRKLLTVLFGQSGHGKTSLLRAGLVPRLRPEGYCPVYVRVDYSPAAPPPSDQIKREVFRVTHAAGTWTQSGAAIEGESLWEFLHHRDDVLHDPSGKTLIPILIFDQFEEIFTLAQTDDAGRHRAQAFLSDLADLVENRPPEELEARIDRDEVDAAKFDFARADYRILIALREDYLAHLEGLKTGMPSVTLNRVRLARFTGQQALDAVLTPAPGLVTEEVAAQIVRFVAGGTDVARAEVEPSLLSLVCRELNSARLERNQPAITADLLAGSRETILQEFYERALADQPAGVRRFIEDELLTESGHRESVAEERVKKALVAAGAKSGTLGLLVEQRLLRVEERLDVRRVELTHDVLCGVVMASRSVRHEREARDKAEAQLVEQQARAAATRRALVRARAVATVCAVITLLAIASAVFGWINLRRARAADVQAQVARGLAEQARSEAEKLVGFLLDDFYDELKPTGRLETVGKLAHKAVAYYDGLPPELLTPNTRLFHAMALMREGSSLGEQGRLDEARPVLARAEEVFQSLRKSGDHSEDVIVGLAETYVARGTMGVRNMDALQKAADLLRPLAKTPTSSRRVRALYADVLNYMSHGLPKSEAYAMCEESRQILAALGALDLTDLNAAAAYGDVSDSQARHALAMGRLADAERLEREVGDIAEKVLRRRPGDLRSMLNAFYSPDMLSDVAAQRFDYAAAMDYALKAVVASESYVRFNPADMTGWQSWINSRNRVATLQFETGHVKEALEEFRATVALKDDPRRPTSIASLVSGAQLQVVSLTAQTGAKEPAEQELHRFEELLEEDRKANIGGSPLYLQMLGELENVGRIFLDMAASENREALDKALAITARLESVTVGPKDIVPGAMRNAILGMTLTNAVDAALNLDDPAKAEKLAQKLVALPLDNSSYLHRPEEITAQANMRLAHAVAREGRAGEARDILAPTLAYYRSLPNRGTKTVTYSVTLARSLMVSALAQPTNNRAGRSARSAALSEATKLMDGLSDEATALTTSRMVSRWITETRAMPLP